MALEVQKTSGFSDAPPAAATGFSDTAPLASPDPVPKQNGAATPVAVTSAAGPDGHTEFVEIPAAMVGKLIGKGGETIKALQFTTHTKVQIDHQTGGDLKKVSIMSANREAIENAKAQIDKIVNSDEPVTGIGEVSKQVDCPQGIVGRIIGRGGETIRALQQASQAHIVVDQNFPEGHPRSVNIKGRPDAVERASKMVSELIQGEPGSAQAIIQKVRALPSTSVLPADQGRWSYVA
jgi:far upstream element-binding protein